MATDVLLGIGQRWYSSTPPIRNQLAGPWPYPLVLPMRFVRVLALVVAILFAREVHAGILGIQTLNSNLTFGTGGSYHFFYDVEVNVCDLECEEWVVDENSWMEAADGELVQQTISFVGGQVVSSDYLYRGGLFTMELLMWRTGQPDRVVSGRFTAPIVSMTVSAPNATASRVGRLFPTYVLGPGRFDASLARGLGIARHTVGGERLDSDMLLYHPEGGDHTSVAREAEDGASWLDIRTTSVPAPTALLLVGLGIAGHVGLRRRTAARGHSGRNTSM